MLPSGLFIDSPEMTDVAMQKVSQNPDEWPEEIIQRFKERIPKSVGLSTIVKFLKKNDEHGTATGSIIVTSAEKEAAIPIIIREFNLYPLDVMIAESRLFPLTPDYFAAFFQSSTPFLRLEEYPMYSGLHRFEDASLWQANFPPGQGRYAYASAGYEILDKISDTIDGSEFRKVLMENPLAVAGFSKHGHIDVIKKIANLRPVNMNEFRQGAENLIPRNIVSLRMEGPNKYNILSNSDSTFAPAAAGPMDRHSFQHELSKITDCVHDTMNEVDQNGEKLLYMNKQIPEDPLKLIVPYREKIEEANEFDHYRVMKKDGVSVEGVVIPTVIDFDMKVLPLKIFIGKGMGTIQENIAGVRLDNSDFKLRHSEPRTGQTGTFVYMQGHSKALCTLPVTIKSIVDDMGDFRAKVVGLNGQSFSIRIGHYYQPNQEERIVDDFKRIARVADGYVLPAKFFWVPMEGFFEISSNPDDYTTKIAAKIKTDHPVTLISTGQGGYSMKGVDKYASAMGWDKTNLTGWQAKFLLASLGAGEEKVASLFKESQKFGAATEYQLNTPKLLCEKVAGVRPLAKRMSEKAAALRTNLVKEASQLENAQTVDSVLALNFINPDNISKFVGFLPRLKAAISNLCALLMASRLGMEDIPEMATSTALYRMLDVVNGLEQLRVAQEQGVQQ